ncbi:hypothetical protein ShzoTeo12_53660 (plasmid) [Shinella zoogloeoides]|nr:hypothetical protein ShzoTeo12_53660 [Shinella zoogloeoides]
MALVEPLISPVWAPRSSPKRLLYVEHGLPRRAVPERPAGRLLCCSILISTLNWGRRHRPFTMNFTESREAMDREASPHASIARAAPQDSPSGYDAQDGVAGIARRCPARPTSRSYLRRQSMTLPGEAPLFVDGGAGQDQHKEEVTPGLLFEMSSQRLRAKPTLGGLSRAGTPQAGQATRKHVTFNWYSSAPCAEALCSIRLLSDRLHVDVGGEYPPIRHG